MSILRSYIDKNNTIVSNSLVNTGRNPVIELNFGASDLVVPNYGYSRLLFNLDLSLFILIPFFSIPKNAKAPLL